MINIWFIFRYHKIFGTSLMTHLNPVCVVIYVFLTRMAQILNIIN